MIDAVESGALGLQLGLDGGGLLRDREGLGLGEQGPRLVLLGQDGVDLGLQGPPEGVGLALQRCELAGAGRDVVDELLVDLEGRALTGVDEVLQVGVGDPVHPAAERHRPGGHVDLAGPRAEHGLRLDAGLGGPVERHPQPAVAGRGLVQPGR